MNISQTKDGKKLTIHVEGRIDTNTSPVLLEYLQKEMPGVEELTIDLEKTDYISSAGLRVLLFAQKTMAAQGKMFVSNVNKNIMETFELTCFNEILTII